MKYDITLGYRCGDKAWSLTTQTMKSDGDKATLTLFVRNLGPEEDHQFWLHLFDDGDDFQVYEEAAFKEQIELIEAHAGDELDPDCEAEETEKAIEEHTKQFWKDNKPMNWCEGMGYSVRDAAKALRRRWEAVNELVQLETSR